jgi:hypothetical protein
MNYNTVPSSSDDDVFNYIFKDRIEQRGNTVVLLCPACD